MRAENSGRACSDCLASPLTQSEMSTASSLHPLQAGHRTRSSGGGGGGGGVGGGCVGRRDDWHFRFKLRANRRNNSQHCCANNGGSCWVTDATTPNTGAPTILRVVVCVLASGVQTDTTTPNIVAPTTLGVVAFVLAVECKRMQQLPTLVRLQCWELLRACVGRGVQTDATTPNNVGTCSASSERYNP